MLRQAVRKFKIRNSKFEPVIPVCEQDLPLAGIETFPLAKNVRSFLNYLTVEAGLSNNTILGYGRDLRSFLKYCKSNNINELQKNIPQKIW